MFNIQRETVINFSGGRTSGALLINVLKEATPEQRKLVRVVFANTGLEHEKTYDYIQKVDDYIQKNFGVSINYVEYDYNNNEHTFNIVNFVDLNKDGLPFKKLCEIRKFLPNVVARFCTQELKIRISEKFLRSIGWVEWDSLIGFRSDESHRVAKLKDTAAIDLYAPLHKAGWDKARVLKFWAEEMPFDLEINDMFGNCVGCFLKGQKKKIEIFRAEPHRARFYIDLEASAGAKFRADRPDYAEMLRRASLTPEQEAAEARERRRRAAAARAAARGSAQLALFQPPPAEDDEEADIACSCTD